MSESILYARRAYNRWQRAKFVIRTGVARMAGARVGPDVLLGAGVEFRPGTRDGSAGRIEVGARSSLERGAVLHAYGGSISIGENAFIGPYTVIYGHGNVTIGANALIAMHCRILSSNHTVPDQGTLVRSRPDVLLPTRLGQDVWLGAGATILGGVTIGDGCIVGAGAVVTSDLPPYSIAYGTPARVVRYREIKGG
jgi:acetyltransferase-like isoleucine patch superfamily enzyme